MSDQGPPISRHEIGHRLLLLLRQLASKSGLAGKESQNSEGSDSKSALAGGSPPPPDLEKGSIGEASKGGSVHAAAVKLGRKGGVSGGPARMAGMTAKERSAFAAQGGRARQARGR